MCAEFLGLIIFKTFSELKNSLSPKLGWSEMRPNQRCRPNWCRTRCWIKRQFPFCPENGNCPDNRLWSFLFNHHLEDKKTCNCIFLFSSWLWFWQKESWLWVRCASNNVSQINCRSLCDVSITVTKFSVEVVIVMCKTVGESESFGEGEKSNRGSFKEFFLMVNVFLVTWSWL